MFIGASLPRNFPHSLLNISEKITEQEVNVYMMHEKHIPKTIGIIMDGNRRWAKEKGVTSFQGHKKGYENIRSLVQWAKEAGVKNIILYAFSTENWNRKREEVSYLMKLCRLALEQKSTFLPDEHVRVRFIGDLSRLPEDIQSAIHTLEQETEHISGFTLVIAFSYGGRAEIIDTVRRIRMVSDVEITEENFNSFLWTSGIPDPDLIIRTGGARRLSNFLPWQSVYAELFFTDAYWPDFSRHEFEKALEFFENAKRNFGK